MPRVFLFCPENDIALSHGLARFTPPRQAALLARFGAPLMWWAGNPADFVLIPAPDSDSYAESLALWADETSRTFGPGPRIVTSLHGIEADTLMPWGWSAYSAGLLQRAGGGGERGERERRGRKEREGNGNGTADIDFDALRMLSHRRTATAINRRLAALIDFESRGMPTPAGADEAFSTADALRIIDNLGGRAYMKSPWSSSGRGIIDCSTSSEAKIRQMCDGIIASQGSVMIEQAHIKEADFAMLFEALPEVTVRFLGYSRFFNAHGNAYGGNLIASDLTLEESLAYMIPASLLRETVSALERILTDLVGGTYTGYLGIDMMAAHNPVGGSLYLVPCVELNLRMTMGVIAHFLARREALIGRTMTVTPAATASRLPRPASERPAINLVPPNPFFSITAQ